jgi:hypothetical protein
MLWLEERLGGGGRLALIELATKGIRFDANVPSNGRLVPGPACASESP